MKRQLILASAIIVLTGCAARPVTSPEARTFDLTIELTRIGDHEATLIRTPHYRIVTTLRDNEAQQRLADVMESAYAHYARFAVVPADQGTHEPFECHVFDDHEQWVEHTRAMTGADASIYLGIARGGYTIRDRFVVYRATPEAIYPVAAHEGWHQFAARHFRQPLPPFLEEGIACLFESVRIRNGVPVWDLRHNDTRRRILVYARDQQSLPSLGQLITMHAGQTVTLPPEQIELFYAQAWALARFLVHGEEGRHRPALLRMLADASNGSPGVPPPPSGPLADDWPRRMLSHYLGTPWPDVESAYVRFVAREIR